jgi:hypothetical protein
MSMLLQPERFNDAVHKYEATTPQMQYEGMAGYMEVDATFEIKDLTKFAKLWDDSYTYPSDRSAWYHKIKSQVMGCN